MKHHKGANSRLSIKILSIIIATSGASILPPIHGIGSTRRLDQALARVIGRHILGRKYRLADSVLVWRYGNITFSSLAVFMILESRVRTTSGVFPPFLNTIVTSCVARYLNDLWVFDTQEYKWQQVEFRDTDSKPSYVAP